MNNFSKIKTIKNYINPINFAALRKYSTILSIILHSIFVILILFGLPFAGKKIIDSPHVIVEIMPISKIDNLPTKSSTEQPKKEIDKPKPLAKQAEETPKPQETKKEEPKPQKIIEPVKKEPVIPEKKPTPVEKPKEIVPEKPKVEKKLKDKKQVLPKAPPKEKKILDKNKIDDYESLLKNIDESAQNTNDKKTNTKNHSKIDNQDLSKPLSITTESDIKRQLYGCWSPPSGAKNAKDMTVLVRIKFAPDGSIIEANHIETGIFVGDVFYKAAVSAALRAVWKCSPLQIPKEEYDAWKEIEFNFNPSSMIY